MATPRSDIDFSGLFNTIVTARPGAHHPGGGDSHHAPLVLPSLRPGGFPEEIFTGLSEEEKKDWECSICYLIVRAAKRCTNGHLFCATCILTWSISNSNQGYGRGSCPVCRDRGQYRPDFNVDRKLARKHVRCPERGCGWKGVLRDYRLHARSHGKEEGEEPLAARLAGDDARAMAVATRNAGTQVPSAHAHTREQRVTGAAPSGPSYSHLDSRIRRGRQNLEQLFTTFGAQLERRGRDIEEHYRRREAARQEQLREVSDLGRRLSRVSTDLMYLLGNMNRDSERYHTYIRQSANIEAALQDLSNTVSAPAGQQEAAGSMLPALDPHQPQLQPNTSRLSRAARGRRLPAGRVGTLAEGRADPTTSTDTRALLSGVRGHNPEVMRPRNTSTDRSDTVVVQAEDSRHGIRIPHMESATTSDDSPRLQRLIVHRQKTGLPRPTGAERPGNLSRDRLQNGTG